MSESPDSAQQSSPESAPVSGAPKRPKAASSRVTKSAKAAKVATPRKSSKSDDSAVSEGADTHEPTRSAGEVPATSHEMSRAVPQEAEAATHSEWPEPDAASAGHGESGQKRKRRRRKGKGGQSQHGPGSDELQHAESGQAQQVDPQVRRPPAPVQPRAKIDPELLTKMAWKIYLAEVSEEGVALIGDHDAKDLARRCFRLAEIFIDEQLRRH